MSYLMQHREGPCRSRIIVINDGNWRYLICHRKAAKSIDGDIGVVGAQVSKEKDKDSRVLNPKTQICKRVFD